MRQRGHQTLIDVQRRQLVKFLEQIGALRHYLRQQRNRLGRTIPLLSQIMSERAYLLEKLHELAALNVDQRLMTTLTHLSTDRSFTASDGRLKLENTHHRLLCEMVGATRESIALALSRLVSAGIAERRGMTFLIEPGSFTSSLGHNGDREATVPVAREMVR